MGDFARRSERIHQHCAATFGGGEGGEERRRRRKQDRGARAD